MNTVLGIGCIFAGCGGLWWSLVQSQRKYLETVAQLVGALQQMAGDIQFHSRPLPRIITTLATQRTGTTGAFFQEVDKALSQGYSLEESWTQGAIAVLPRGIMAEWMVELGHQLTGTGETICKAISLVCVQLSKILEEERRQSADRQRRTTALCFSGASLVVILLM